MKPINVLSAFDGCSCGQLALQRATINVSNYFASEIKESAIKCTQSNYPKTIQLGSIIDVKAKNLPKIDLLIGGSPCKGISRLNQKQEGLSHPESKLFWEYVRLLEESNATYFLLENTHGNYRDWETDRKSTRLNSSHSAKSRMPSSA